MAKVPKGKTIYYKNKKYTEGQECPFLTEEPKEEKKDEKKKK